MIEIIIFTILYGFIPLIVYFFVRREWIEIKSILPYIVLTFISSFYEFVFTYLLECDVKYWFIVYNSLAFLTIGYFFYKALDSEYKLFFYLVFFAFLSLLLFVKLNWNNYVVIELSSYLDSFQTIVILLFSIFWFRKSFIELKHDNLLDSPTFYFISGLILYYCGTMVLFLMSYSIYQNNNNMFQYYLLLNVVLNFVLRTLLIVGIWKARVK